MSILYVPTPNLLTRFVSCADSPGSLTPPTDVLVRTGAAAPVHRYARRAYVSTTIDKVQVRNRTHRQRQHLVFIAPYRAHKHSSQPRACCLLRLLSCYCTPLPSSRSASCASRRHECCDRLVIGSITRFPRLTHSGYALCPAPHITCPYPVLSPRAFSAHSICCYGHKLLNPLPFCAAFPCPCTLLALRPLSCYFFFSVTQQDAQSRSVNKSRPSDVVHTLILPAFLGPQSSFPASLLLARAHGVPHRVAC